MKIDDIFEKFLIIYHIAVFLQLLLFLLGSIKFQSFFSKAKKLTQNAQMFVNEVNEMDGPTWIKTAQKRTELSTSTDLNQWCIIKKASSTPTAKTKKGVISLKYNYIEFWKILPRSLQFLQLFAIDKKKLDFKFRKIH